MKNDKDLKYYLSLHYKTITYFNKTDNSWTACHPELGEGSCYVIADTEEEARKLLDEEKEFLIKHALENDFEIPEPKDAEELPSGQFIIRIERSLHKALKEGAEKENVSLNHYVASILSRYVGGMNTWDMLNIKLSDVSELDPFAWTPHLVSPPQIKYSFPKWAVAGSHNVQISIVRDKYAKITQKRATIKTGSSLVRDLQTTSD
jgi:antitoxin HicB